MNILNKAKQDGRSEATEQMREKVIEQLQKLNTFGGEENAHKVIGRIMGLFDVNPDELMKGVLVEV